MADLRGLMEGLGYEDVTTVLNSGNVVFSARGGKVTAHARRIERALAEGPGVATRVLVLTASELAQVLSDDPFAGAARNHSRYLVGIAEDPATLEPIAPLLRQSWGRERLARGRGGAARRALYLWVPDGVYVSRLNAAVSRILGEAITARNWATLLKLRGLAD
jgi:uncharacterized protein (DUF1697 family)